MQFFPVCALLIARHDRTAARDYGTKFVSIAAAIGLGVMLLGLIGPERIMVAVWGSAYAGTGGILRVLFFGAPFVFVNLVGVMVANAMGQERRLMRLMGFATVCNVSMNAIAIRWWGGGLDHADHRDPDPYRLGRDRATGGGRGVRAGRHRRLMLVSPRLMSLPMESPD